MVSFLSGQPLQELPRVQNWDPLVLLQIEQVEVTADNEIGLAIKRAGEDFLVRRVSRDRPRGIRLAGHKQRVMLQEGDQPFNILVGDTVLAADARVVQRNRISAMMAGEMTST